MWNLKRNNPNELTYKIEKDTDLKNELMVAGKKGECRTVGKSRIHCCI